MALFGAGLELPWWSGPSEACDDIRLRCLARRLDIGPGAALVLLQETKERLKVQVITDANRWMLDDLFEYDTELGADWVFDSLQSTGWLFWFRNSYRLHHQGRPDFLFGPYRPHNVNLDVSQGEWHRIRREVIARDGPVCSYCGDEAKPPSVDHVLPLSRGGKTQMDNLRVACKSCNSRKSSRTPEEWGGR